MERLVTPHPGGSDDMNVYSMLLPVRESFRGGAYVLRTEPGRREAVLKAAIAALDQTGPGRILRQQQLFDMAGAMAWTLQLVLFVLVGDVPTQADKDSAGQAAKGVEKVKQVYNELRVGSVTPFSVITNDTWLTTKVRAALIDTKNVPSRTIVVTTERGVVYLQGKVTETESQLAAKTAAGVNGVNKVVKLFEIVSRESLVGSPAPVENKSTAPAATPASPASSGSGAVETMPIK